MEGAGEPGGVAGPELFSPRPARRTAVQRVTAACAGHRPRSGVPDKKQFEARRQARLHAAIAPEK